MDEAGPRPLLLVDGWDEVGPLGEELRSKLLGLMAEHPRLMVVVTSRPYGEARPSYNDGFEILDIQPLSSQDIFCLARCFFSLCYGGDLIAAEAEAINLIKALDQMPKAKELARTALLLTMMLLISRSRPLPDKRHSLYEACIENLLTSIPKRRFEQGALSLPGEWRPEDSEERMRQVADLAFRLQSKGYRGHSRSPIVQLWDDVEALLPSAWSKSERLGFLSWLVGPAGLLTDRSDGTLVFSHLSFQEYLSAWHLNATIDGKEGRIETFLKYLPNRTWWETLRLWAALVDKQNPGRLDSVMDFLGRSSDHGLSLSGMIFSDGHGGDGAFKAWVDLLARRISLGFWPVEVDLCAQAWSGSRQEERRLEVYSRLEALAVEQEWPNWLHFQRFCRRAFQLEILSPGECNF